MSLEVGGNYGGGPGFGGGRGGYGGGPGYGTKTEEALEDMTTTMMEEILEVQFHLSEAKYLTGGWRGGV